MLYTFTTPGLLFNHHDYYVIELLVYYEASQFKGHLQKKMQYRNPDTKTRGWAITIKTSLKT